MDNSPERDANVVLPLIRGPLQVIHSFEGLTTEPNVGAPRRRRRAAPQDVNVSSAVPLHALQAHDAEAPSNDAEDEAISQPLPRIQPKLIFNLTINRVGRIITIAVLGFWGGWSLMPAETKVPVSAAWVAYICVITDWVVFTTNLDCMCPTAMNWYFRDCPKWKILAKENMPEVKLTGYGILNTLVGLGIAFYKYIQRNDQQALTRTDIISGSLLLVLLYWLSCVKVNENSAGAWFFCDDYSRHISNTFRIIFALMSWWWIAFRILAIVNILRNRDKPELALQVLTLTVGLAIECFLLLWFFSIPVLGKIFTWFPWDEGLWYWHLPPLLAMLASWLAVVITGLWADLPNILYPCSGSTSAVCSFLIEYA